MRDTTDLTLGSIPGGGDAPSSGPTAETSRAASLVETARALVASSKGLLAMDESTATCNARFVAIGIAPTEQERSRYRAWIVTTPGLHECISGTILADETLRQRLANGMPLVKAITAAGMIPGIKVDLGAHALAGHPGEQVTDGLDGLRARLAEYAQLGARFAKWRAVIAMRDGGRPPSRAAIEANAHALARYAGLCQEAGLVPIVEPELPMEGTHSLESCREVTDDVLRTVFRHLAEQQVALEGMLLKPNMVLPGLGCPQQESVDEVAAQTVATLLRTVPAAVPGIAFLSGGQPPELATARLQAMTSHFRSRLPWAVTFSFARAIQGPALQLWGGLDERVGAAQQVLLHRALCNHLARRGIYTAAMEGDPGAAWAAARRIAPEGG